MILDYLTRLHQFVDPTNVELWAAVLTVFLDHPKLVVIYSDKLLIADEVIKGYFLLSEGSFYYLGEEIFTALPMYVNYYDLHKGKSKWIQ